MFLVRSIRRRLISGFFVALSLMLILAGAGVMGLIWHQEAVDELNFLLNRSPDRGKLSRKVSQIGEQLYPNLDLRQPQAVELLRASYRRQVDKAMDELTEFRRRIEDLPQSPELHQQRPQVLSRLDGVDRELRRLFFVAEQLRPIDSAVRETQLQELRFNAQIAVGRVQHLLDTLPAYEDGFLESSLEKERKRSTKLLKLILIVTGIAVALYPLTIYFGFQWISVPLRNVARGATRIANGDFSYRLPPATRWQDEFNDLVEGVNCMADRFQQAQESLQEEVNARSEQLVRSQRLASVGFLAAGVAHEINNPLSAISMASESMEMRLCDCVDTSLPDAQEIMQRLQMIRNESRRCGEITRRLLDFSRGEKSEKVMDDLTRIIHEVLAMVRHLGRYSDRIIQFDRVDPLMVEINSAQMKQVILNLVANALQATPPGGSVQIEVVEHVDNVQILVQDNGCGMDAETLQNVFDPFYSTKEVGQGTGLGLSITHRLVEDHHGTILPSSKGPGQGSTFRIRLPKRQPMANAA